MKISAEEKIMYNVMKAIYDSGIPIDFKGSMVLKACLMELGLPDEIRHTVDIDANWYSDTSPTDEQMTASLQKALADNDIDLEVRNYRSYGEGRSAGFELIEKTSCEVLFSMDIDVNRPVPPTKIYEIAGFRFRGVAPVQMLSDKIYVTSTDKIFRRIKDLVDIYYISKVFELNKSDIIITLKNSNRTLENFNGFLNNKDDLEYAYDKFRFTGEVDKPLFEEVYCAVKSYIEAFLTEE